MYSVTCVEVCCTHSIPANLIGWSLAIARAAVSPTANWTGVTMHARTSGIRRATRWERARRPRSMPTAYTEATRKPVTRYAARIMCGTSYGTAGVKITFHGWTAGTPPHGGGEPLGWVIHELTATTENAPPTPQNMMGTPAQKCVHGF